MSASETARRYRQKHPERHTLSLKIQAARTVAALRVAMRHQREWDNEITAECARRGIPRQLPPLDPMIDGRGRKVRR